MHPAQDTWRSLHRRAVVVDAHVDTFTRLLRTGRSFFDSRGCRHINYRLARRGGADILFASVYTRPMAAAASFGLRAFQFIRTTVRSSGERLVLLETQSDLRGFAEDALRENPQRPDGPIGIVLLMEGGLPLGDRLENLDTFFHLGLRILGLTHQPRNRLADGTGVRGESEGLSSLGKRVVRRAQELGIVLDVAHLGARGFWELLGLAEGPVISSHTGLRRFCDIPRNLSDDQVRAVARTGGVVAIDFYPAHLSKDRAAWKSLTARDVAMQISYLADLVGADHVGFGSDFDGIPRAVRDLGNASALPQLTKALMDRGFQPREIQGILGRNFLRVLRACLP